MLRRLVFVLMMADLELRMHVLHPIGALLLTSIAVRPMCSSSVGVLPWSLLFQGRGHGRFYLSDGRYRSRHRMHVLVVVLAEHFSVDFEECTQLVNTVHLDALILEMLVRVLPHIKAD